MKSHYILFVLIILFSIQSFGQNSTNPVRFQMKVEYLYSGVKEDCKLGGGADNTLKFQAFINGTSTTGQELCWYRGDDNGVEIWPDYSVYDNLLPDLPKLDVNYRGWEESRGDACDYNRSGICVDNQLCDVWVTYNKADLINAGPPAQWNRVRYDCSNNQSWQWIYRYNPLRPNQPKVASGIYNACGLTSYTIATDDVAPKWGETYRWEESKDGLTWYPLNNGNSNSITVIASDVSAIEQRMYRVFSVYNSEVSVASVMSAPVWIYPKRPTISTYNSKMPSCYGGSDATINLQTVDGKLGNGVSKYRVYLSKQVGTNWQPVDLIDPYITSIPYTFTNSKVYGGQLKAGKYQIVIENVVTYAPTGSDPYFVCASSPVSIEIGEPPLLVLNSVAPKKGVSNFNISCTGSDDGVIRVTATGGTPLYKFKITSTDLNKETALVYSSGQSYEFTDLKPNINYTVSVIDANNCIAQSSQIKLTEPTPVTSLISLNTYAGGYNIRCFGSTDTAYVLVNGGVSPYSVSSGVSSVSVNASGTTGTISGLEGNKLHNFIIKDANGCINNNSATLTQTPSIFTSKYKSTTCNGEGNGTIELGAVGGYTNGGIYTFILSKNLIPQDTITGTVSYFENLGSGDFNIKIKDKNNCSVDTTVLIPLSAIAPDLKDTVICQGQVLTLDATEAGNTYYWTSTKDYKSTSPILTTSTPAQYNLLVTNQYNCTANVKFNLEISDRKFTANFAIPGVGYEGDTIVITEFSWPRPSSMNWTMPVTFEVDKKEEGLQYIKLPEEGVYTVKLTAFLGECWDDLEKKITVYDASLNPDNGNNKLGFSGIKNINLYPNPNSGKFTLIVELTDVLPIQIDVHDLFTANALDSKSAEGKDTYSFDYNLTLAAGTYNVTVRTSNDKKTFKFVVQ